LTLSAFSFVFAEILISILRDEGEGYLAFIAIFNYDRFAFQKL